MMFRSYSNTSEYFLSNNVAIAMVIFRLVKITCYFLVRSYHVYVRKLAHLVFQVFI